MVENALHSFEIGLKAFGDYKNNKDKWKLKECILFLHHAIELLIKEMLYQKDLLYIFENFDKAIKARIKSNKKGNEDVFSINPKLNTVSFNKAIDRIEALYNPEEFKSPINLKENFRELNNIRNRIEHFSIEIEERYIIKIINAIYEPSKRFFEKYLEIQIEKKISLDSKEIISNINMIRVYTKTIWFATLMFLFSSQLFGIFVLNNFHALISTIFIVIFTIIPLRIRIIVIRFPIIIVSFFILYYVLYLLIIDIDIFITVESLFYLFTPVIYTFLHLMYYRNYLLNDKLNQIIKN